MTPAALASDLLERRSSAPSTTSGSGPAAGVGRIGRAAGIRPEDCLGPVALLVWGVSVASVDPSRMTDYGLLAVLPVAFFLAVGLLVASIAVTLHARRPSAIRLGLHVVALVLVLHGTVPLILSEPNYPWTYKHVGVTDYINLHGGVKASVDIYQSWPGFFAAAAWFTRIAGVGTPLAYAAWAPVYFNLLTCLMLGFVFRSLPVARMTRWLAMFVFVAGNWVGQDYFSPQAFTFVLALAVLGMVLAWLQVDRPPALVLALRGLGRRLVRAPSTGGRGHARRSSVAGDEAAPSRGLNAARLVVLLSVFAAVVVSHQLSPYMVIIAVTGLVLAGKVRPRWIALVLAVEALAYLVPHLSFLQRTQDLFGSLFQPFANIGLNSVGHSTPEAGRRILGLAAPALILGLWGLAALGAVRRVRAAQPTLVLAVLAGSPFLLAMLQSYGGEAVLRIYLFSLPWTALLAASALAPRVRTASRTARARSGVVLAGIVALFMGAFYGSEELYRVQPGALRASVYFYEHAAPGSVLILGAPQFPLLATARYDRFVSSTPTPDLLTDKALANRHLGAPDIGAVAALADNYTKGHQVYLALTTDEQTYAQVLGILPKGSLQGLAAALGRAPQWRAVYRNASATLFQYRGPVAASHVGAGRPAVRRVQAGPAAGAPPSSDRSRQVGALTDLSPALGRVPRALQAPPAGAPSARPLGSGRVAVEKPPFPPVPLSSVLYRLEA